jgi:hypothetical protein
MRESISSRITDDHNPHSVTNIRNAKDSPFEVVAPLSFSATRIVRTIMKAKTLGTVLQDNTARNSSVDARPPSSLPIQLKTRAAG